MIPTTGFNISGISDCGKYSIKHLKLDEYEVLNKMAERVFTGTLSEIEEWYKNLEK